MRGLLLEYDFAESFYDDCTVFLCRSKHLDHLEIVLAKFAGQGMIINFKKCQFMRSSVPFLGHVISKEGVKPTDSKTLEIVEFETPRDIKMLKTFLGMASYHRRFIPEFVEQPSPLNGLLEKDVIFRWNDVHQSSFDSLKRCLQSSTSLVYPDFTKPFVIAIDSSKKAGGFVLSQENAGTLRPVLSDGRSLSETESRYDTTDFSVKKCEYYLVGNRFVVYTDHKPLVHLKASKDVLHRRCRWISKVSIQL